VEWINDLKGKTVGLDTAPLIYFMEENPVYSDTVKLFFEAMDAGATYFFTNDVQLPRIPGIQILSIDAITNKGGLR